MTTQRKWWSHHPWRSSRNV